MRMSISVPQGFVSAATAGWIKCNVKRRRGQGQLPRVVRDFNLHLQHHRVEVEWVSTDADGAPGQRGLMWLSGHRCPQVKVAHLGLSL